MVDPYAIVRRLTGHELISQKDAQLLTEAVDGLIDQIGSKNARIAELEAENERLTKDAESYRDIATRKSNQVADMIRAEALSRTGAVKVKALGDWRRGYCDDEVTIEQVSTGFGSIYQVRIFEGTIWLDYPVREKEAFPTVEAAKAAAQADYERRILSVLEAAPPAPKVAEARSSTHSLKQMTAGRTMPRVMKKLSDGRQR